MLQKLEQMLLKAEKRVFSLIMFVMLAILTCHVTMRYLFNRPLIWTDEVTTMMQGTIAFLGIGYCFHKGQHTELSLLYDRMPRQVQWIFDVITNSVMLFCLYHLTRIGFQYTANQNIAFGTVSWMKKSYFYIFIPIGFLIAMAYVLVRLIRVFSDIITSRKGGK
ncbi:MAG: TRAP transporter small permease [Lachnospiraceae bacterium]|nr:TRAP transporter small permease [Lachnospiraceae bacterium]